MNVALEVCSVKKYFGSKDNTTKAIDGIDLKVLKQEFIGIMGKSGCGKTTLLNIISTIDKVTEGSIIINGQDITKIKTSKLAKFRRENLGFIFQDFKLLDNMTSEENIAIALIIKNFPVKEIDSKMKDISEILNLQDIIGKYPYQLSGGQKQRVACARAIIGEPSLILADEPTGSLDSENGIELMNLLKRINEELYSTILLVTHDPIVASYCNRVLYMRDGKIQNELYKKPGTNNNCFVKKLNETIYNNS